MCTLIVKIVPKQMEKNKTKQQLMQITVNVSCTLTIMGTRHREHGCQDSVTF